MIKKTHVIEIQRGFLWYFIGAIVWRSYSRYREVLFYFVSDLEPSGAAASVWCWRQASLPAHTASPWLAPETATINGFRSPTTYKK